MTSKTNHSHPSAHRHHGHGAAHAHHGQGHGHPVSHQAMSLFDTCMTHVVSYVTQVIANPGATAHAVVLSVVAAVCLVTLLNSRAIGYVAFGSRHSVQTGNNPGGATANMAMGVKALVVFVGIAYYFRDGLGAHIFNAASNF